MFDNHIYLTYICHATKPSCNDECLYVLQIIAASIWPLYQAFSLLSMQKTDGEDLQDLIIRTASTRTVDNRGTYAFLMV